MTTHLRKISITVDEPDPGQFFWILLEAKEDPTVWEPVAAAAEPCTNWGDAFDAGCVALCKLVPDERIGPRRVGLDAHAGPGD